MASLVLVGLPGSGKSSVGQAVADRTGLAFFDTDVLLCEITGLSAPDLLRTRGEASFRDQELAALESVLDRDAVIATGGGIVVNDMNLTSDPHIYAVGDATEKVDAVSHGASLIALANIANRQGRRVADHIAGIASAAPPSLGTAIVKVFDLVAASVGWNERRLAETDRRFMAIHSHPFDHATYYPGATRMAAKLIYDKDDLTILGAQIVGRNGVDKRIDVLATAMAAGLRVDALADLELAYAPPFSSAKDPVNMLGYMAENIASGACDVVGSDEVPALIDLGWQLVDVRTPAEFAQGTIAGARNVPLDDLREQLDTFGDAPVIVFCAVGQRGHTAASLLGELGRRVRNLDGGYFTWRAFERAEQLSG